MGRDRLEVSPVQLFELVSCYTEESFDRMYVLPSPGVDYCLLNDHGCEQLCVNRETSYSCQCTEGFVLQSDGKTCKRKLNFPS